MFNPWVPEAPDEGHPMKVLVTGAAKRLGREIALALAAGGWQVAVHYRSSEAEAIKTVADCTRISGTSAAFSADLTNEAAVRALLPRVVTAALTPGEAALVAAPTVVTTVGSIFEQGFFSCRLT